ncbi:cellulose biosynthesis protein BcsG [Aliidiomarina indica]|uniref:cellulose biosynthesis protein BcsG n=1 Tax=Aliidiomarina indica TaxID=2749147 RepID=UPI00188E25E1|nr:cellulose biosynthesis protein BcsG [Aliidiomarina indica]
MSEQLYQRQRQQLLHHPLFNWPGLGAWSFYFLIKAGMALFGYLELELLWNLTLFAFLVVPVRFFWLRFARQIIAIVAATSLLYTESHLPPFSRLIDQWELVSSFSFWYSLELIGRIISLQMIAALLVAWILYLYLSKLLRMTTVTLVAIVVVPLLPSQQLQPIDVAFGTERGPTQQAAGTVRAPVNNPDALLSEFYARQQEIQLRPPATVSPDFDILMVNVCSLSWQDLEQFDLLDHPFLVRSDLTLTNFFTGSSYSGPATLRLLQSSCGHVPHSRLFEPLPACTLNQQLQQLGFRSEIRMNHTGAFDNFLTQVQQLGGLENAPFVEPSQFPTAMMGFDQSPIYSDRAILTDWLEQSNDAPNFTFYNTTSLHDGNRLPGFRGNSIASYRTRLQTLLDDLNQLYDDIIASERAVLVVIVPEHGAGLRGDQLQLPGMREIPTPALTHVPVMMRLFGPGVNDAARSPIQVARSTGPTAITSAIYQTMEQRPFSGGSYDPSRIAQAMPEQRPVLENDRVIMMEIDGQFFLQINHGDWRPYMR